MTDPMGLYVSIPFCKAKCSFCNFASGVFAAERMQSYVDRLCQEVAEARSWAERRGVDLPDTVDTIYVGGGTPTLLEPAMVRQVFQAIRGHFVVASEAEITVEGAPGQVSESTLAALQEAGMNRMSFGVQSFVDAEGAAVGRLHTASDTHAELLRMQRAGISRLAIDLIAGLPGQISESWKYSVDQALATGVTHVSLYMLEVDDGSRLGREALAGGSRYGASELPADDDTAQWYEEACGWLGAAGIMQYEISNFAQAGAQSKHNRKYWERQSYLGVGLDAHSMLRSGLGGLRWSNTDDLACYVGSGLAERGFTRENVHWVNRRAAFEEELFLGLRLVKGVNLNTLRRHFGDLLDEVNLGELFDSGLIELSEPYLRLTSRGRMVSNEVFGRLLLEPVA